MSHATRHPQAAESPLPPPPPPPLPPPAAAGGNVLADTLAQAGVAAPPAFRHAPTRVGDAPADAPLLPLQRGEKSMRISRAIKPNPTPVSTLMLRLDAVAPTPPS